VDDNVITLKAVRSTHKFIEAQIKEKKIKCITDNCIFFINALDDLFITPLV